MPRVLQSPRSVWQECSVERAGVIVDADDYYRAFFEACQRADRYILLAGWQFDTDAALLRGAEAEQATLPVTLLEFLDALCERNDELRIYILAWDFHAVFSLEREWMQQLRFNWMTNERLQFLFDSHHAEQGSHHQKFVVIDGRLSFLGGLDLCDHRWDDRNHRIPNPLRVSRGAPHRPFHDVQAFLVGSEVGHVMTELFRGRWQAAGGAALDVPTSRTAFNDFAPRGAFEIDAQRVSLSRTDPSGAPNQSGECREICALYADAIAAARSVIYIETQYFSSREIGEALAKRLSRSAEPGEPPLDVILVLNMEAETFKEEVAVGLAQAKVIAELRQAAARGPHRLGVYYSVPHTEDEAAGQAPLRATYIHSKLMIVDDRLLTVGSANLTNRSMCVDTELNMTVEADATDSRLEASIRRLRLDLLSEHLGPDEEVENATASSEGGLVATLDDLASRGQGRLRLHPSPTANERAILEVIDPQQLPFDPAGMEAHDRDRSIFIGGIGALWTLLSGTMSPSLEGHAPEPGRPRDGT